MIGCPHRDKKQPRCWGSCVQAKDKLELVHWSAVVHNVITTHIGQPMYSLTTHCLSTVDSSATWLGSTLNPKKRLSILRKSKKLVFFEAFEVSSDHISSALRAHWGINNNKQPIHYVSLVHCRQAPQFHMVIRHTVTLNLIPTLNFTLL